MQHVWAIRRTVRSDPDGQRRWERAYQHLMSWTAAFEPPVRSQPPRPQEVHDDSGTLCSCFDTTPGTGTNH